MLLKALEIPIKFVGGAPAMAALGVITAGVAAVGVFIKKSIDNTVKWADELDALQDVTNLTTAEVAGLNYVLRKHGVDADAAAKAYTFLNKNLVEFDGKLGSTGRVLDQYGIKVRDANGVVKTNGDLTAEIAQRYAALSEGQERVNFLTQVYGKSSLELNDALLDLAQNGLDGYINKAKMLGLDIDADRVQKFKQNTAELNMIWEALGINLGMKFIPIVEKVQEVLADILTSDGFQKMLDGVLGGLDSLSAWFDNNTLEDAGADVTAFVNTAESELKRYIKNVQDLVKLQDQGLAPSNATLADGWEKIAVGAGADLVAIWHDVSDIGKELWDIFKKIIGATGEANGKFTIMDAIVTGLKMNFLQFTNFIQSIRKGLDGLRDALEYINTHFAGIMKALATGAGYALPTGNAVNRASGGPVTAGQAYNVSEFFRPEVFVPQTSGRIDPVGGAQKVEAHLDEERLVRLLVSALQQGATA